MDKFMAMSLIMKELSETDTCHFSTQKHGVMWEIYYAKTIELIKSFGYKVELDKIYSDGTLSPVDEIPEGNKVLVGRQVSLKSK